MSTFSIGVEENTVTRYDIEIKHKNNISETEMDHICNILENNKSKDLLIRDLESRGFKVKIKNMKKVFGKIEIDELDMMEDIDERLL